MHIRENPILSSRGQSVLGASAGGERARHGLQAGEVPDRATSAGQVGPGAVCSEFSILAPAWPAAVADSGAIAERRLLSPAGDGRMPIVTDAPPDPPPLTRVLARALARAAAGPITLPVPEMPMQPLITLAVVAFSALLAITAFAGATMIALSVALCAGIMAWGWAGLVGLPSPRGTTVVLAVGSAGAIGTALATRQDPFLAWMPAALAGSMMVAFVHQLARRDGRPRLVESIAATITAIAIVVSGASLIALSRSEHGPWVVAIAATAMATSALSDLAGVSRAMSAWLLPLGMVLGGIAAILVGHLLGASGWGAAALLGVLSAGISHAVRRVLATVPAISGARSQLVSACASVLTGGVVVYVVGRLLVP